MQNTITPVQERADEIKEAFEFFEDWQDRYGYIIDIGRKLPPLSEADRTEENRVHGCQSQVWLATQPLSQDAEKVVAFTADSDSALVKGLLALVHRLYSGQSAQEILAFNFDAFLEQLQLDENLTMNRGNGLRAVVQRVRQLASQQENSA